MGIHQVTHERWGMVNQVLNMTTGHLKTGALSISMFSAALVLQEHPQDPTLARTMWTSREWLYLELSDRLWGPDSLGK